VVQSSSTSETQVESHSISQQKSSYSHTSKAQASQLGSSAAPVEQRACWHDVGLHDVSPQTEATSFTHAAPQVLLQHEGLVAQIMATHGSHAAVSLAPVAQSL
jgi:hypothetical protein